MYLTVNLAGRIAFAVVALGAFALLLKTAESKTPLSTQSQVRDRLVTKRPWRVEPVTAVAAKSKRNEKINIGKAFQDEDDWLDGFTITFRNDSDKVVTALVVELIFPREPGDARNKFAEELSLGPSPITAAYMHRNPNRVIKPGETGDLQIRPDTYKSIKDALQTLGYPEIVNRVEITITEVGFDDGSVLLSGKLYVQDPANPNDPTKKIPAVSAKTKLH